MLLSLNYLLAALAFTLSGHLWRAGPRLRSAAIHMLLFGTAALLGGLGHQLDAGWVSAATWIASVNEHLPLHLRIGRIEDIYTRLWFATLIAIGATEYYFMHIFLHPLARALGRPGLLRYVQATFATFCLASVLTRDYAIVILFHVFSHVVVIAFAIHLARIHGLRAYKWLAVLCAYNLALGLIWAAMGTGTFPAGPLHHNDWYHFGLMAFVIALHRLLTRTELVSDLVRV